MSAGLPYLRGRRRRFAALLLPALVLRALIPFGFMPLLGGSGLTVGFCPGEGALPAGLAAANQQLLHAAHLVHLGHDHALAGGTHGGPGDPGRGSSHEPPCPFAASAKPAFAPAILVLASAPAQAAPSQALAAPTLFLPTIVRAQSPRGPPQIA